MHNKPKIASHADRPEIGGLWRDPACEVEDSGAPGSVAGQYVLGDAQILRVIDDLVDATEDPDHEGFDQVGVCLLLTPWKSKHWSRDIRRLSCALSKTAL